MTISCVKINCELNNEVKEEALKVIDIYSNNIHLDSPDDAHEETQPDADGANDEPQGAAANEPNVAPRLVLAVKDTGIDYTVALDNHIEGAK